MSDMKHVIDPERMGVWVAATFVLALLALVLAFVALHRNNDLAYVTQAEVMVLNKKVEDLKKAQAAPAPIAPAANAEAPAADAAMAPTK